MVTPIRNARPNERKQVMGTFVLAFGSDPIFRWMWPDPGDFLENFPKFVDALGAGDVAYSQNTVFVTDGFQGAAHWLSPGVHPDEAALEKVLIETTRVEIRADIAAVGEKMSRFHIKEPHWYLPTIGVQPLHHGQGLGGGLMAHALAICDRDGLPAYLESSNPRNISLYRRHGFEPVGEIQAGSSPVGTAMLRPARKG